MGLLDGLLVELLVVLEAIEMGFRVRVLAVRSPVSIPAPLSCASLFEGVVMVITEGWACSVMGWGLAWRGDPASPRRKLGGKKSHSSSSLSGTMMQCTTGWTQDSLVEGFGDVEGVDVVGLGDHGRLDGALRHGEVGGGCM